MRDQKQIVSALTEFREAAIAVENSDKDQDALKRIQVDFCYAENEIETGPDWNVSNILSQIKDLTEKVRRL